MFQQSNRPTAAQVPYGCPLPSGNPYSPTGITPPNLKDSHPNDIPEIDNRELAAIERGEPYEPYEPYEPDPYVGGFPPPPGHPSISMYNRTSPPPTPDAVSLVANCPVQTRITKYPVIVRSIISGEVLKGTFITKGFTPLLHNEPLEAMVEQLCKKQGCMLLHAGTPESVTAYLSYEDNIRILDARLEYTSLLLVEKTWADTSRRASL